ncbi:hypothetical protein TwortDSMZ_161 [Staphylococcus phage Twort]|uniref:ORF020 n=2 Tax=Staphylococcus phage Twort (strain DSM 17442 / HER 48) TaxID=2908167 RepID=Q4Z984_BPTWO|nr:ORF020 [Staphylococcus phage Twort]AAX92316.1 ORF020 [Staphylococcus phage Twort]QIW89159.1 hypothetical protein TwortDSMZ_161 [Staphylococcus phage Twort]
MYKSVEEVYAIVFGVLAKDEGKIVSSKFNKILNEIGIDRVSVNDLKDISEMIHEDDYLNGLKNDAILGKVSLKDLESVEGKKVFKDNNYLDTVSTYVVENEKRLSNLRELRKHQKNGAYMEMLMEGLKKDLVKELKNPIIEDRDILLGHTDKELVLLLSDFHVGFTSRDLDNKYNFEVLTNRLTKYLDEVQTMVLEHDIDDVSIFFVGDLVEHINMRDVNQAFDTEFTMSEQISKGTRLLIDIIKNVSEMVDGKVTFGIVAGNHDRLQGNKNHKIYNDSVAYIVLDTLLCMQENGVINDIDIIDNREDIYKFYHKVNNTNICVTHGDSLKGKGKNISKVEVKENIDVLVTGHVHHFSATQEDFHKTHVVASSPIGFNNYSKELNLSRTSPSQQMLLVDSSKNLTIKTVFLD